MLFREEVARILKDISILYDSPGEMVSECELIYLWFGGHYDAECVVEEITIRLENEENMERQATLISAAVLAHPESFRDLAAAAMHYLGVYYDENRNVTGEYLLVWVNQLAKTLFDDCFERVGEGDVGIRRDLLASGLVDYLFALAIDARLSQAETPWSRESSENDSSKRSFEKTCDDLLKEAGPDAVRDLMTRINQRFDVAEPPEKGSLSEKMLTVLHRSCYESLPLSERASLMPPPPPSNGNTAAA